MASPSFSSSSSPACCPESVVGSGSRITLLGCGGTLYCSRLMSWQERLGTLQQLGKWGLGLWLGLELYKAQLRRARPIASATAGSGHESRSGLRSGNGGSSDRQQLEQLQQLQQWLLGLLLGYVSAALTTGRPPTVSTPAATTAAAAAALVAVDLCLLLPGSQPTVLFQRIFPMFQVRRTPSGLCGTYVPPSPTPASPSSKPPRGDSVLLNPIFRLVNSPPPIPTIGCWGDCPPA